MKKTYSPVLALLFLVTSAYSQVTYTGKPMFQVDIKRGGNALGSFTVELFPNIAYYHVRHFDSLVSVKFFDTIAFHRVKPTFMIQGGDPNSRHGAVSTWGYGQPGQPTVVDEFSAARHLRGILSAASTGQPNSATSQFFICVAPAPSLNGNYSIYGRVTGGMNLVDTIVTAPTVTIGSAPSTTVTERPILKHEMFITYIGSNDTVPKPPVLNQPVNGTVGLGYSMPVFLKWSNIKDGIIYTLEVSDDPGFSNILQTNETANLSIYTNFPLTPETKYYWRVKTNNGGHFSPWAIVSDFETAAVPVDNPVGLATNSKSTAKYSVFPNPSTGKFTFSGLNKGDKIEIYDITGKRILEYTSKDPSLTIDLEGKEKGIYFYKVVSEKKQTVQGKLVLK